MFLSVVSIFKITKHALLLMPFTSHHLPSIDTFDKLDPRVDSSSSIIDRDNQLTAIANLTADEMYISYPCNSCEELSSGDSDWEHPVQERGAFDLVDKYNVQRK